MFKLYHKSQEAQVNWIRSHPVQYVALNAILLVAYFGYIKYCEPRWSRKLKNETLPQGS